MALTKIGSIGINTGIAFAGVTTIATLNASDNVLSVGGTVNFVSDVSIGGTVSIAGTLTYEDVTNVDAVGLITARDGIKVGSGITLSVDGDIFATGVTTATTFSGAFSGSGANITALNASNLASGTVPSARLGSGTASSSTFLAGDSTFKTVTGTTINNNADNRLITGSGTANTLEGESTLTFGSDLLNISSTTQGLGLRLTNTGNEYTNIQFSAARTAADNALGILNAKWNDNHEVAAIYLTTGDDTSNKDDGKIKFYTSAASGSLASRMEILNDGNVKVSDGDLVIGTSGHGIDFSATSGSGTSELFDDYEEGTFTPEFNSGSAASACYANGVSYSSQVGVYRKVGHVVHFILKIQVSSGTTKSGLLQINNLPFTSGDFSTYSIVGGSFISYTSGYFSDTADIPTIFIQPGGTALQFYNTAGNNFAGSHLAQATGRLDINGHYFTS